MVERLEGNLNLPALRRTTDIGRLFTKPLKIILRLEHRHERIANTAHWQGPPALFWLSSYVASHHLVALTESGAKDQLLHCFLHNFKVKL